MNNEFVQGGGNLEELVISTLLNGKVVKAYGGFAQNFVKVGSQHLSGLPAASAFHWSQKLKLQFKSRPQWKCLDKALPFT